MNAHLRMGNAPMQLIETAIEPMESRRLLSAWSHIHAAAAPVAHHLASHAILQNARHAVPIVKLTMPQLFSRSRSRTHRATHAKPLLAKPSYTASPEGYSPSRFRAAYGIQNIHFGNVVGDGTGQTIAIVDAFDQPNIAADLATFDTAYNLPPPPSFQIVNGFGGTRRPPADPNRAWELETSLDVEWAHAIAPNANILLVETSSDTFQSLIGNGVNTARNYPGVVAISMSWGDVEWSTEHSEFDSYFSTPANHAPVSFFAATGDNGSPGIYPSYSPNVVAVGGTSLNSSSTGTYNSETGWGGSGGGPSQFELLPAFQNQPGAVSNAAAQDGIYRTTPDVSLAADPYQGGVSVVDSFDGGAATPWVTVGGTSAGSPMWAALVAIADQGRAGAGLQPLDGNANLLPRLYNLPANMFHDITQGDNGYQAGPGYDMVTGIGSPMADQLVGRLAGGAFAVPHALRSVTTVSSIDVHFSEPMDTSSFSVGTGIAGFTGPGGADLQAAISGFTWTNPSTLRVTFTPQSTLGTYALSITSAVHSADGVALDQNGNMIPGEPGDGYTAALTVASPATVVNRATFYNASVWDGNSAAANATADNAALATDKQALVSGQTATSSNITNYARGINGIIVDVSSLVSQSLSAADFTFKVGTSGDPSTWATAPDPTSITVFPGAGVNGSDRIEILWPDAAIHNQWLQVTVKPSAYTTGLATPDVFYFGNLTGLARPTLPGATSAGVTISDVAALRYYNLQAAGVTSWYDPNRDGTTSISDVLIARANNLQALPMITAP